MAIMFEDSRYQELSSADKMRAQQALKEVIEDANPLEVYIGVPIGLGWFGGVWIVFFILRWIVNGFSGKDTGR